MFHYYKDLEWMKISNEEAYNKRATISSIDMRAISRFDFGSNLDF